MSKRVIPVLLLLATTALAGCGDSSDSDDTAKDTSSGTPTASSTPTDASSSPAPASGVTCDYPDDQVPTTKQNEKPPSTPSVSGKVTATVTTSLGDLTFTLDADRTPCTVNSFVSLAQQNYFNGTHCHRLVTLETGGIAVLQCGDPTATGSGGPGYVFDDEVDGTETYTAGVLAMANRGPDTNGSQFFIVFDDSPLDPAYTVFGHVDDAGIAAIKDLAAKGVKQTGNGMTAPAEEVDIESVTIK
ncbi:peptidylprolyl isomerase [Nocardioides halotolerans]|uniref:peptidylprolyl isomerase n=1 Tax=Nocardioides halotolerans TaxID=433660 RepID=UPI0004060546|nr:peptidylprolyl isomerase [Nocardioides halotolerans]